MVKIYLDVDGVLLGQESGNVVLARHAEKLIDFLIENFDVYWLTTHCSGDARRVISYLSRYAPQSLIEKLSSIKPTRFGVVKTDAISGDFYWLDDNPLQAEIAELRRREKLDRWIDVNTRARPDDLLFAIDELLYCLSSNWSIGSLELNI
jgi:hypothetical protein